MILAVSSGKRPSRPTKETSQGIEFSHATWELVKRGWAQEPSDRPDMQEIVLHFENLLVSTTTLFGMSRLCGLGDALAYTTAIGIHSRPIG